MKKLIALIVVIYAIVGGVHAQSTKFKDLEGISYSATLTIADWNEFLDDLRKLPRNDAGERIFPYEVLNYDFLVVGFAKTSPTVITSSQFKGEKIRTVCLYMLSQTDFNRLSTKWFNKLGYER